MRRLLGIGVVVAVVASGCGSTKTVVVTQTVTTVKTVTTTKTPTTSTNTTTTTTASGSSPCSGTDLQATFTGVAGSAGAGHVSYDLVLTNTSSSACSVSGIPVATLLDKTEGALPTQISTGPGTATTVVLQHGDSAKAEARLSPDVPGVGEQQTGPCERTAYFLRVTAAGGGTVNAPIGPPTPVCEHGALSFSPFAAV